MASKLERTTVRNHKITCPHAYRTHRQISTFSKGKCLPWAALPSDMAKATGSWRTQVLAFDLGESYSVYIWGVNLLYLPFPVFFSHLPSFTSGVYPESTSWPSVSGCHICIIVKLYSLHGWSLWHDRALVCLFKVNLGSQRQRKEIWLIVRILMFLLAEKSW